MTLKLYRLNEKERPEERKRVLEMYYQQWDSNRNGLKPNKNDFSFRFILP